MCVKLAFVGVISFSLFFFVNFRIFIYFFVFAVIIMPFYFIFAFFGVPSQISFLAIICLLNVFYVKRYRFFMPKYICVRDDYALWWVVTWKWYLFPLALLPLPANLNCICFVFFVFSFLSHNLVLLPLNFKHTFDLRTSARGIYKVQTNECRLNSFVTDLEWTVHANDSTSN